MCGIAGLVDLKGLRAEEVSQRCEAAKALAHAERCDAPQHEGREGPCILARRSAQQNTCLVRAKNQPVGVENGREGVLPVSGLFLQGAVQPQRVPRIRKSNPDRSFLRARVHRPGRDVGE